MTAEPALVDRTLAAIADPHRRRAVELLRDGPLRAGELAAALDVAPPVMSRHLRVLRESGLIQMTHPTFDARVRIYALQRGAMSELKAWLAAIEQGWSDQLTSLKQHVEQAL